MISAVLEEESDFCWIANCTRNFEILPLIIFLYHCNLVSLFALLSLFFDILKSCYIEKYSSDLHSRLRSSSQFAAAFLRLPGGVPLAFQSLIICCPDLLLHKLGKWGNYSPSTVGPYFCKLSGNFRFSTTGKPYFYNDSEEAIVFNF